MHATLPLLRSREFPAIARKRLETLQVNVGYKCNQTCVHCHVNAGPNRTEAMPREVADTVLAFLRNSDVKTLDITGGAPELNPHFRYLVIEARKLGVKVMDRCNLTILNEPGHEDLAEFLAAHRVEVVASLPCYLEDNVDRQRGKGVFSGSIVGLRKLNALGYGRPGTGLVLNLVYNPQGPSLPPAQGPLEDAYRSASPRRVRRRVQPALHARQHADRALRLDPDLEGAVQQLHDAAPGQLPRGEPRAGDVPDAALGRLAGLRLRLRLQPDARAAGALRPASAGRGSPTSSARTSPGGRSWSPTTASAAPPGRGRAAGERLPSRDAPGRNCPLSYRYSPDVFRRAPEIEAETLYVIGGLYGNPFALDAIVELAAQESPAPTLVFNGDFNWFDVDPGGFAALNARVLEHVALRGNVETELANDDAEAGLRLRLPGVRRRRRRRALERDPRAAARDRARLPGAARASRGPADARRGRRRRGADRDRARRRLVARRVALRRRRASSDEALERAFDAADVSVFASSHTCLPVTYRLPAGVVANNGAAGMPNFRGTRFGLVTRISTDGRADALYGERLGPVVVETLAVRYDHERWLAQFDRLWPAGSPAAVSYRKRITDGPGYDPAQAVRRAVRSPAAPRQNAATG